MEAKLEWMEFIDEVLEALRERGIVSSELGGGAIGWVSGARPGWSSSRDAAASTELVLTEPSVPLLRRRVGASGGTTVATDAWELILTDINRKPQSVLGKIAV